MPRATRWISAFVVLASIWTAKSASAQSKEKEKAPSAKSESVILDSATVADVQKAADQLAIAVHEAVRKATEDPAVKVAALKVAKNAVAAAQIALTQQAETIESVLNALARDIALATEKQQKKSKSH